MFKEAVSVSAQPLWVWVWGFDLEDEWWKSAGEAAGGLDGAVAVGGALYHY